MTKAINVVADLRSGVLTNVTRDELGRVLIKFRRAEK